MSDGAGTKRSTEEGVVGQGKPVLLITHLKAAAERHVDELSRQLFCQGGELRLTLGIGARNDQPGLVVEDAEMTLAVKIELAVDGLSADETRQVTLPMSQICECLLAQESWRE